MMDDCSMTTNSNFSISEPCNTFTYIFHIFACYCHNNITVRRFFLRIGSFVTYIRNNIIHKQVILCIYLTIMDTRKPVLNVIFLLKISSARYSRYCTQFFILHPIWAKLLYQFP